jgi:hypothetical protein
MDQHEEWNKNNNNQKKSVKTVSLPLSLPRFVCVCRFIQIYFSPISNLQSHISFFVRFAHNKNMRAHTLAQHQRTRMEMKGK